MPKNLTLRLDDAVLRKARHLAVEEQKSLSQWVADLIAQSVARKEDYADARRRALARLERGMRLGGRPLSREEAHER